MVYVPIYSSETIISRNEIILVTGTYCQITGSCDFQSASAIEYLNLRLPELLEFTISRYPDNVRRFRDVAFITELYLPQCGLEFP